MVSILWRIVCSISTGLSKVIKFLWSNGSPSKKNYYEINVIKCNCKNVLSQTKPD